jgi:iron complex transport system substrate-binding protein
MTNTRQLNDTRHAAAQRDMRERLPRLARRAAHVLLAPRVLLAARALLAVLAIGCARTPAPPGDGLRLVSTAPNLTECVCAIGAAELLAGRTEACDYPPEAVRGIPVTGGFGAPWIEPVLAVHPTHVLETVLSDPSIRQRLDALRIPVVHVPCARLPDIPGALRQLGALTAREAQAEALAATIQNGLDAARREAETPASRPRVLLLFAPDTPITAGRNAFVATLLELAGGSNLGGGTDTDYYHVSIEWVIGQDPDLLLCLFDASGRPLPPLFAAQTGWKSLRAVREGRVYTVPDLGSVSRPGPRVLEGLAQLKTVLARDTSLHPPHP